MPNKVTKAASVVLIIGAGLSLSACVVSRLHLTDDFGATVKQNVVAQVADPDARYTGTPAPGAEGHRADLAQSRYNANAVIPPLSNATSSTSGTGGGSGGSGGSGP